MEGRAQLALSRPGLESRSASAPQLAGASGAPQPTLFVAPQHCTMRGRVRSSQHLRVRWREREQSSKLRTQSREVMGIWEGRVKACRQTTGRCLSGLAVAQREGRSADSPVVRVRGEAKEEDATTHGHWTLDWLLTGGMWGGRVGKTRSVTTEQQRAKNASRASGRMMAACRLQVADLWICGFVG